MNGSCRGHDRFLQDRQFLMQRIGFLLDECANFEYRQKANWLSVGEGYNTQYQILLTDRYITGTKALWDKTRVLYDISRHI